MFPISSSRPLAGEYARSAAALINCLSVLPWGRLPRVRPTLESLRQQPGNHQVGTVARCSGRWYLHPAVSRRRVSSAVTVAVAAGLTLAACGGSPQDANVPVGRFRVDIPVKSFPASQTLAKHTSLVIVIRNPGPKTIPDPSVTICNMTCGPATGKWHNPPEGQGTTVLPFSVLNRTENVANLSKTVWAIDQAPNPTPCINGARNNQSYNCASGGPGGSVSVDSNTWALGHPLKPHGSVRFEWKVTPVCTGKYTVAWQVSGGLFGGPKAVLGNGSVPQGSFTVNINGAPQQSYVDNSKRIVQTASPPPAPNHQSAPVPTSVPCNAGSGT